MTHKYYENNTCIDLQGMDILSLNEEMYPEYVVNFLVSFLPQEIKLTRKCNFFVAHTLGDLNNTQIPDNIKIYYEMCASINFKPLITFTIFSNNKNEFKDFKNLYFTKNYYMEKIKEIKLCEKIYYIVKMHRKLENDGTNETMTDYEIHDANIIIKEIRRQISFANMPTNISENSRWWHVEAAVKNYIGNKLKIRM